MQNELNSRFDDDRVIDVCPARYPLGRVSRYSLSIYLYLAYGPYYLPNSSSPRIGGNSTRSSSPRLRPSSILVHRPPPIPTHLPSLPAPPALPSPPVSSPPSTHRQQHHTAYTRSLSTPTPLNPVYVHGWVYDLETGVVTDLNVSSGPPGWVPPPGGVQGGFPTMRGVSA
ncbi:hypothetical protein NMY22_g16103 [Coprinellus aureogranulatus]|nr:hypothetical protein NMY22_g16103 [Coprinellus aureogranulatus]